MNYLILQMYVVGFFLISLGLFFLFLILIILLGYFFQYHLFKSFKTKKISLTTILESFGVGAVIYILYSYCIINFARAFNIYTIYLPLVIFDIFNLILVAKKRKVEMKKAIQHILSKKQEILMLTVSFLLLLLVMGVIETHLNLGSTDPFRWAETVLYLHRYGDFDYDFMTIKTGGFVVFCAGALLLTNDFYIHYFFIKYVSTFIFYINVLAIYKIASRFLNKKIEIFMCLIISLSFNFLLYRSALFIPSAFAVPFCLIFIMTLFEEADLRILFLRGILIAGMFLAHVIYGPIFIIYFLMYEVIILFSKIKQNRESREAKTSKLISTFFKQNLKIFAVVLICTIPYVLNLIINDYNFFNFIYYNHFDPRYLIRISNSLVIVDVFLSSSIHIYFLRLTRPLETNVFYNLINFGLNAVISRTLNWGIIFIFLGLLYKNQNHNEKIKYILNFIKFSFILSTLLFLVNAWLLMNQNIRIFTIASFLYQYGPRVFELFSALWSLLVIFGVMMIFNLIKKIKIKKIRAQGTNIQERINSLREKLNKAFIISLIILSISLYSSHLIVQYNFLYTSYYDDDNLAESVLFITDYFNEEELDEDKIELLLPELPGTNIIYHLIYQKNVEKSYFEFDDTSYSELKSAIDSNESEFVLVDKTEIKSSGLEDIDKKMDVLFENTNYLFFKVE